VHTKANDRLQGVAHAFPHISAALTAAPILYADFYPAGFGAPPGTIGIICGMRVVTALKTIKVARDEGLNLVLSGQPCAVAAIAARLAELDVARGGYALLAIGGYESFAGLEEMMQTAFAQVFERVDILQLYGANEVDFALLAGQRDGVVRYYLVQSTWTLADGGAPHAFEHSETGRRVEVEDSFTHDGDALLIQQPETKIAPQIRAFLEARDAHWWRSHTGHLGLDGGRIRPQLRRGAAPSDDADLSYGAFIDRFDMELQTKPDWSGR